ncbi:unnamed protein product [Mytilus coruscus]|uniref:Uncharacterized protein n=1 Tax=Mytilus coruscus TaxID=42192 RepID=A0A6J8C6P2_MYTCO|nr:unnamed protein product [Mytilus coruscus]
MAKYLEDLESGDHFIEKNLEVNISSARQSILQDVKSFRDININTTSSTLQIKAGRIDQAQHLVPKAPGIEQIKAGRKDQVQHLVPKYPRIEKMKPSLLTRLKIPKDNKSFNNDGIFIRNVVTFKDYTCDACFVRNNTVAVALGLENKTAMVDIEKNKIIHTINFSHNCYGVASDGKTFIISCGGGLQ